MSADQIETIDHLSQLIVYEDASSENHPFMIVKIDGKYVVCDKAIPFKD